MLIFVSSKVPRETLMFSQSYDIIVVGAGHAGCEAAAAAADAAAAVASAVAAVREAADSAGDGHGDATGPSGHVELAGREGVHQPGPCWAKVVGIDGYIVTCLWFERSKANHGVERKPKRAQRVRQPPDQPQVAMERILSEQVEACEPKRIGRGSYGQLGELRREPCQLPPAPARTSM